ncbi:nucleotide sugar dehydrogenase [Carnobacterium maltaromaticum]|uniref:Nucleotide sugar dehydrogenase n=1 Tax=Carnobacterium maltaromaticum TaxID=2751 RepID=A0AAW9K299_CARML|nr:nucleotide sugar dehydrogenase [Carnobacterium maltaromaticum]MDZ5757446.1 nucleotide sugar dehydrogenase [Carnobacterium maltaromaticum]
MKIITIGLGYIGLPTAVILSQHSHEVVGVDINSSIVHSLNEGLLTIEEPGLDQHFQKSLSSKQFKAQLDPEAGDVFIIAVPTPNHKDALRSCDLSYVEAAVVSCLPYLKKGNVVIVESTIAPRSMSSTIAPLIEAEGFKIGEDIFLGHCPERVLPGNMMFELKHNPRIIGGMTPSCTKKISELYATFVEGELIQTEAEVAELSKLMENTYRDVNIALANELVKIGNHLNIDALKVIQMANKHPRVNLHMPGPGVGGHCLAVDPYFVAAEAPEQSPLIQTARGINESMPHHVVEKIEELMFGAPTLKIAILGLAYKGNIDDARESPALVVIDGLREKGFELAIHDQHVEYASKTVTIREATKNSSLVVVLTDHLEYKDLGNQTFDMARELIFDTKTIVSNYSATAEYLTLGTTINQKQTVQ